MRVDGAQFSQAGLQGDGRAGDAAAQQGSWRGEAVMVQASAASLLADAAEELTFAQAEREEEKEVSERHVRPESSTTVPQIQEIMAYLQLMGDDAARQGKLEALTARLRGSGGAGAGHAAREAFADISEQFLALAYVRRRCEEEGEPAAAAAVAEDLEALVEDHGPAIRAGLNTAEAARDFAADDPGRSAGFRECYRETVLGREALGDTFNAILDRFGGDDTRRSISALIRAVGDDLAARGPSTAPAELRSILEDLYQLEVLATVLDGCNELKDVMARDFDVPALPVDKLMKRLVGLAGERWVGSDRFTGLARDLNATAPGADVAFLTRTKGILRDIPLKVFADPDSRDKVIQAAQEALDLAIEDEEA